MGEYFLQELKCLRILLCACLFLSLMPGRAMAEVCSRLKVGGLSWPPIYQPATILAPASGVGVDLLKLIERELGVGFEFQPPQPFILEQFQLVNGDLDVIVGLYPNPKRLRLYEMSRPYYREPLHAYSLAKHHLTLNNLADLQGLVAVVSRGTSYGMLLDEYFANQASVIPVSMGEQRMLMLLAGRADYLIDSPLSASIGIEAKSAQSRVRMSEQPLSWQEVSMAFSRASPCRRLVPDVNRLILEKRFGGADG